MGIPVRRDVVTDADFIGIDVIADTDGCKALPACCQRELAFEADLIAIGLGRIIRFGLDVGAAGKGRQIRRKAVITDEIVFVDLVVVIALGVVVDVLDVPAIVQDVGDVATGQAALGTAAAFFLVEAVVGVGLQVTGLRIPQRGCHSSRSHGQGGQGRCNNKFFHNLPPPYNTGYFLP